jgi:hypothetical protein
MAEQPTKHSKRPTTRMWLCSKCGEYKDRELYNATLYDPLARLCHDCKQSDSSYKPTKQQLPQCMCTYCMSLRG